MREQRRYQRVAADHDVVVHAQGRSVFSGKIRNVSRQGMYVIGSASSPDTAAVALRFSLPKDRSNRPQLLRATVIHRHHNGMGLLIDLTQPKADGRLCKLVALCQEFESHSG